MLFFAAHDPGAKNHIRPLYEHALLNGKRCEFIDLSKKIEFMEYRYALEFIREVSPNLLVSGCSICARGGGIDRDQPIVDCEWPLIKACCDESISTVVVVDLGSKGKLDGALDWGLPSKFLVTNKGTIDELVSFGMPVDNIVLTGSAHLEAISRLNDSDAPQTLVDQYKLPSEHRILSFFTGPDLDSSIAALTSLTKILDDSIDNLTILVKPHPRVPYKERLVEATLDCRHVVCDESDKVNSISLLRGSCLSLSMASTVTLESLVLGVPSAFYQIGWDFGLLDELYSNVMGIIRIRREQDLNKFVSSCLDGNFALANSNLEFHRGALERSWQAISDAY